MSHPPPRRASTLEGLTPRQRTVPAAPPAAAATQSLGVAAGRNGTARARGRGSWLGRPRPVLTGLLIGSVVATTLALASRSQSGSAYLSVADVKPGMKGYGLTVFAGTTPERFGVEVISTLHQFRPNQDLILIRTDHPRLDVARTVAGMSGSPIFIDGKMIGAYAYGWYFGVEPIAGVTPIESMLADMRRPLPPSLAPRAGRAPMAGSRVGPQGGAHASVRPPRANRFLGSLREYDARDHARQVADRTSASLSPPKGTGLAPASTTLLVGGLSAGAFQLARELFEPIGFELLQAGTGGGTGVATGPARFEEGGVLAVQLVRGDVSASGLGTVTHVVGDKVLGFGHPMLGGGFEDLPTATGVVHWVLATQNRSFKIGEPTVPLGSLINDRQSAVIVDTKRTAPTFPLRLEVSGVAGAPHPVWNMEVANDPFLAPNFTALALGSALETTTAERVDMTWRATTRIRIEGYAPIEIDDYGSGSDRPIGPSDLLRARFTEALGLLMSNPWEPVTLESVDSRVKITYGRDVVQLRGVQLLESEVEPGQTAHLRLHLQPFRGPAETKVVDLPIPAGLAPQTLELQIQPGYEVSRLLPDPESVADLVSMLPQMRYDAESVVIQYRVGDGAATFRGRVAHRLPPGATDMLRSTTESASPEVFASSESVVVPIQRFVTGRDTVRIKVRSLSR